MSSLNASSASVTKETKQPNVKDIPTTVQKTIETVNTLNKNTSIKIPKTEILLQLFSDRILIIISQFSGKVGSFLSCTMEHSIIDNSHTYHVSSLLGKRDDALLEVYARQITERIVSLGVGGEMQATSCPPVLLGIALKDRGKDAFDGLIAEVLNMYKEGVQIASSDPLSS